MNSQKNMQTATVTSNNLKFNGLPKQIQERLLERQRGKGEGFAIKTSGIFSSPVFVIAAVVWICLVIYLTNDYSWSKFGTIIIGAVSLAAIYLLFHHLYKLIQWFVFPSRCYLLITPHYLIEMRFNNISYWNIDEIIAPNAVHNYQNGIYTFTRITLSLENDLIKSFDIKGIQVADDMVEQIYSYKKLFVEATAKNDKVYLNSKDDFIELQNQLRQTNAIFSNRGLKYLITATSVITTAAMMFGVISLNNFYDDKKSWNVAESINRASSFRTYLKTHTQGRWRNDAQQKVQELYNSAEQKYTASLNKGYDRKAANAVLEILKYAKTTQNYHVKVAFDRHYEIPPNIVEDLKKQFEVKNILTLGDSFSSIKMSQRESRLLAVVTDAFNKIIPDDILEFSDECVDECVNFKVVYNIDFKDSLYFDTRQNKLTEDERTYYPGIVINWDFGIQTPNQPQIYNFELKSSPAAEISYYSESSETISEAENFTKTLDADKSYIYDSMVASAFDDFKANLAYRMGIGTETGNADETTEKTAPASPTKEKKRK